MDALDCVQSMLMPKCTVHSEQVNYSPYQLTFLMIIFLWKFILIFLIAQLKYKRTQGYISNLGTISY